MTGTHTFVPWSVDPTLGVCQDCGRTVSAGDHQVDDASARDPRYAPYAEAVLAWALANGGVPHSMGGMSFGGSVAARVHLSVCPLDESACALPEPATTSEFVDTDTDYRLVEVSQARLTCRCRLLDSLPWVVAGNLTVGEVIYQVVAGGDSRATARQAPDMPLSCQSRVDAALARLLSGVPAGERRNVSARLVPAFYQAIASQLAVEDPAFDFDKDAVGVWPKVVYVLESVDAEVFRLLTATGAQSAPVALTFRHKRLLDWP